MLYVFDSPFIVVSFATDSRKAAKTAKKAAQETYKQVKKTEKKEKKGKGARKLDSRACSLVS